eukprot:1154343-Pelagomonas_calceolata.AAC.1
MQERRQVLVRAGWRQKVGRLGVLALRSCSQLGRRPRCRWVNVLAPMLLLGTAGGSLCSRLCVAGDCRWVTVLAPVCCRGLQVGCTSAQKR